MSRASIAVGVDRSVFECAEVPRTVTVLSQTLISRHQRTSSREFLKGSLVRHDDVTELRLLATQEIMISNMKNSVPKAQYLSFSSALAVALYCQGAVAQQATAAPAPAAPVPAAQEGLPPEAAAPAGAAPEAARSAVAAPATVEESAALPAATEPAPAPVATEPPPAPAEPQATKGSEDKAADPKALKIGDEGGHLKLSSLMQGWFLIENQKGLEENRDTMTTFRLRRAEIKLKGELVKDAIEFSLMVDPSKTLKFGSESRPVQPEVAPADATSADIPSVDVPTPPSDTSILQDFYITAVSDYANVSIGQFKLPMSYEGYNSSSALLFPERSPASKLFGDKRDIGVRAEKKIGPIHYIATVVNGRGPNRLDNNNQKEVYGRLEYFPAEWLMFAVAGGTAIGERSQESSTKDRVEGDVRLDISNFLFQFEYLHGWDGATSGTRLEGRGLYGAIGYTIAKKVQPVVRVSYVDPNVGTSGSRLKQYDAGLNYFVYKDSAKLQVSYSYADQQQAEAFHTGIASVQLKY